MLRKWSMPELQRDDVATFRAKEKLPCQLLLEDVRSALNVGSAFRTADAFALRQLWLCGITATPPHKEILKTALGATESVPWQHTPDIVRVITDLRAAGTRVWAVEQAQGSTSLADFLFTPTPGGYALVFGNEVTGVSEAALAACEGCIEIPQLGTKHSLNIAVTVGILAWEAARQLHYDKKK